MIHNLCSTYLSLSACSFLFQSSQVVIPICFKLRFWWWTLPSELTYPSHLPFFLPHVLIPSLHFICYTLSPETLKLLHIIILFFWNALKKMKKKRKRRKLKKREIRSYKKENKWEHLLPLSLPPLSTLSMIIHLTWEYNHHKWYLLWFYPLCFISIFAFSQVIPLEIVSFISFSLLTRCIQR